MEGVDKQEELANTLGGIAESLAMALGGLQEQKKWLVKMKLEERTAFIDYTLHTISERLGKCLETKGNKENMDGQITCINALKLLKDMADGVFAKKGE